MANNIDIKEIVGKEAIKGLEKTNQELKEANDLLTKQLNIIEELNKEYAQAKNNIQLKQSLNKQERENLLIEQEKQKILLGNGRLEKQAIAIKIQETKETERLTKNKEKEAVARQKSADKAANENREYTKLSKKHQAAVKHASDLAAKYGLLDKRTKAATKTANKYDKQLKNIDASLGKHQRNVGNYTSALSDISPAAASALGGMKKMGAGIKLITGPIGLVITAIALIIGGLKAFFTSSEEGQNAFKRLGAIIKTVAGNIIDVMAKIGKAFLKPKQAIEDIRNVFESTFGKVLEGVINIFVGNLVKKFTQAGLVFQKFKGLFVDNAEAIAESEAKIAEIDEKLAKGRERINEGIENSKDLYKGAKDSLKEFNDEQQREIKIAQSLEDRRAKLVKLQRQQLVTNAKNKKEVQELLLAYRDETNSSEQRREMIRKANKIKEEELKLNESIAAENYNIIKAQNALSNSTIEDKQKEAEALANLYNVQSTNYAQRRELKNRENELDRKIAKERSDEIKERESIVKEVSDEILRIEEELEAELDEIYQKDADNYAEKEEEKTKKTKEEQDKRKELTKQLGSELQNIGNLAFDLYNSRLDAELDALRVNYDARIQAAEGNSALQEGLSRELAKKQYEIQLKQAKAERTQALVDIAINTAVGISKTIATKGPLGIALTGLVAASGLIQTGIVLSQPLPAPPQYAKGTEHSAHTFIAGEAGRELMQTKDGKLMLTPDHATLYNNMAGTTVLPNSQTEQVLSAINMTNAGAMNTSQLEYKLDTLNETMKDNKSTMILDKRGVVHLGRTTSQLSKRANTRFRN